MAILSITIPDDITARVISAVAYNNGYSDTVPDQNGQPVPNPLSKTQFAKDILKNWIKANVVSYEATKAAEDARQAAEDAGVSDITIGD
jgi:hypothetical protein